MCFGLVGVLTKKGYIQKYVPDEISLNNEISWNRIKVSDHDEIVYKLTLIYLREMGYDICNHTIPRVTRRMEKH
jgi:hypothetical protein